MQPRCAGAGSFGDGWPINQAFHPQFNTHHLPHAHSSLVTIGEPRHCLFLAGHSSIALPMGIARDARFYVAGHRGLVGSAIWRELQQRGLKAEKVQIAVRIGDRSRIPPPGGPAVRDAAESSRPAGRFKADPEAPP